MKKLLVVLLVAVASMAGCQYTAKYWGGTHTLVLSPNQKLTGVTWKGQDSLWVLTRPMRVGEEAEIFTFQESSNLGLMEGRVIIKEQKK